MVANKKHRVIGIDFDNTLIDYNQIMLQTANNMNLISGTHPLSKKDIRNKIRTLKNGEIKWQHFQATIYGSQINHGRLPDGVEEFFKNCNTHGLKTYIVSHKTKFSKDPDNPVNLRSAALDWMKTKGFFNPKGIGLTLKDIFFEPTRREKINRITSLKCTDFIDDLQETFLDERFPKSVKKILYSPNISINSISEIDVAQNWKGVNEIIFD